MGVIFKALESCKSGPKKKGFFMKQALSFCVFLLFISINIFAIDSAYLGKWTGTFTVETRSLGFNLNLLSNGMLLDVPSQSIYGYPAGKAEKADSSGFIASLPTGQSDVLLNGILKGDLISGSIDFDGTIGTFSMKRSTLDALEKPFIVENEGLKLPGSLYLPDAQPGAKNNTVPVFLIISASGPTDRYGNSFSVPGKNDAYKQTALALRAKGFAFATYDKRGAGESFYFVDKEEDFTFDSYINDASAAVKKLKADKRFSKVIVLGHAEGSLVGMIAARRGGADGFVSLSGRGLSIQEVLKMQLASAELEPGVLAESLKVLSSLENGKIVKDIPENLNSLFRESVQPYLISWMQYDPRGEIALLGKNVLIIQGDRDLQISTDDTEALKTSNTEAQVVIISNMNHVLKDISADVSDEGNWRTYSDPNYPLGAGLVDILEAFALGIN